MSNRAKPIATVPREKNGDRKGTGRREGSALLDGGHSACAGLEHDACRNGLSTIG
jgi:hypothetical protein